MPSQELMGGVPGMLLVGKSRRSSRHETRACLHAYIPRVPAGMLPTLKLRKRLEQTAFRTPYWHTAGR
jgi:hypothetical protein